MYNSLNVHRVVTLATYSLSHHLYNVVDTSVKVKVSKYLSCNTPLIFQLCLFKSFIHPGSKATPQKLIALWNEPQ